MAPGGWAGGTGWPCSREGGAPKVSSVPGESSALSPGTGEGRACGTLGHAGWGVLMHKRDNAGWSGGWVRTRVVPGCRVPGTSRV